jgi:hypothetical protein
MIGSASASETAATTTYRTSLNLLRKDQRPDLNGMIRRVIDGYRFLGDLSERERMLAADAAQKLRKESESLIASLGDPIV